MHMHHLGTRRGEMAANASETLQADMNVDVICICNIGREGSMASDRSKQTYIIGWDCCGSLALRLKEMAVGLRLD